MSNFPVYNKIIWFTPLDFLSLPIPHSRFLTGPCIWILLIRFFIVISNYRAVNLKIHKRGKFENILDLYYTIECIVGFFI